MKLNPKSKPIDVIKQLATDNKFVSEVLDRHAMGECSLDGLITTVLIYYSCLDTKLGTIKRGGSAV